MYIIHKYVLQSSITQLVQFDFRYAGFYKGVQSAGAAVSWQVDAHNAPLLSELIVNWTLVTISYPLLAVLVILAVKDDHEGEEGEGKVKSVMPALH